MGNASNLYSYAISHQNRNLCKMRKPRETFYKNINSIIAEAYSEDLSEIRLWNRCLIYLIMQFLIRDATSIRNLSRKIDYQNIKLRKLIAQI